MTCRSVRHKFSFFTSCFLFFSPPPAPPPPKKNYMFSYSFPGQFSSLARGTREHTEASRAGFFFQLKDYKIIMFLRYSRGRFLRSRISTDTLKPRGHPWDRKDSTTLDPPTLCSNDLCFVGSCLVWERPMSQIILAWFDCRRTTLNAPVECGTIRLHSM